MAAPCVVLILKLLGFIRLALRYSCYLTSVEIVIHKPPINLRASHHVTRLNTLKPGTCCWYGRLRDIHLPLSHTSRDSLGVCLRSLRGTVARISGVL